MRPLSLINRSSTETRLSETTVTQMIKRRRFLQTLGIVGVGLALPFKLVSAEPIEPIGSSSFRGCVMEFVSTVCKDSPDTSEWINSQLRTARVDYTPRYSGFHYSFASLHIFVDTKIDMAEVICKNGFMVNQFPYYGVDCSCPSLNDLNPPEMARVTAQNEMDFYKCVLAPKGGRMKIEENDHADYDRTIANYPHDPKEWEGAYKRILTKKNGQSYRGYGLLHKTETDANGKRRGDVIISSYDI